MHCINNNEQLTRKKLLKIKNERYSKNECIHEEIKLIFQAIQAVYTTMLTYNTENTHPPNHLQRQKYRALRGTDTASQLADINSFHTVPGKQICHTSAWRASAHLLCGTVCQKLVTLSSSLTTSYSP